MRHEKRLHRPNHATQVVLVARLVEQPLRVEHVVQCHQRVLYTHTVLLVYKKTTLVAAKKYTHAAFVSSRKKLVIRSLTGCRSGRAAARPYGRRRREGGRCAHTGCARTCPPRTSPTERRAPGPRDCPSQADGSRTQCGRAAAASQPKSEAAAGTEALWRHRQK